MMDLYCERCPVCDNKCVREQHAEDFGSGREIYKQSSRCPAGCYGYFFRYDEVTVVVGGNFIDRWECPEVFGVDFIVVAPPEVVAAIDRLRNLSDVTDPEQRSFVLAVRKNPRDLDLRKVYADWLEERGRDDEAAEQRAWTLAKEDGRERIAYLAMSCHVTFDEMLRVMGKASENEKWRSKLCLNFDTPDCMYENEANWKAYEDYTGRQVSESNKIGFVSCAC